jgi:hypothetical protein
MTKNHTALVHGCVDRARPVRPSSESGSAATGREREPGGAFETPTGANVGETVGDGDAAGVAVSAAPATEGAVVAAAVGAAVAVAAGRMMSLVTWPRASCGRQ